MDCSFYADGDFERVCYPDKGPSWAIQSTSRCSNAQALCRNSTDYYTCSSDSTKDHFYDSLAEGFEDSVDVSCHKVKHPLGIFSLVIDIPFGSSKCNIKFRIWPHSLRSSYQTAFASDEDDFVSIISTEFFSCGSNFITEQLESERNQTKIPLISVKWLENQASSTKHPRCSSSCMAVVTPDKYITMLKYKTVTIRSSSCARKSCSDIVLGGIQLDVPFQDHFTSTAGIEGADFRAQCRAKLRQLSVEVVEPEQCTKQLDHPNVKKIRTRIPVACYSNVSTTNESRGIPTNVISRSNATYKIDSWRKDFKEFKKVARMIPPINEQLAVRELLRNAVSSAFLELAEDKLKKEYKKQKIYTWRWAKKNSGSKIPVRMRCNIEGEESKVKRMIPAINEQLAVGDLLQNVVSSAFVEIIEDQLKNEYKKQNTYTRRWSTTNRRSKIPVRMRCNIEGEESKVERMIPAINEQLAVGDLLQNVVSYAFVEIIEDQLKKEYQKKNTYTRRWSTTNRRSKIPVRMRCNIEGEESKVERMIPAINEQLAVRDLLQNVVSNAFVEIIEDQLKNEYKKQNTYTRRWSTTNRRSKIPVRMRSNIERDERKDTAKGTKQKRPTVCSKCGRRFGL